MFDYPVTLKQDGDAVLVTFVDVPEAITFGADEQEALLQAIDALAKFEQIQTAASALGKRLVLSME